MRRFFIDPSESTDVSVLTRILILNLKMYAGKLAVFFACLLSGAFELFFVFLSEQKINIISNMLGIKSDIWECRLIESNNFAYTFGA
jgi:hypothetical protein